MKKLSCIFWFLLSFSCASRNNIKHTAGTNKFDIKKFELNKEYSEVNFTLQNGTTVRQIEFDNKFVEDIQTLNSPFILQNTYFKKTGNLKTTGKSFFSCPIGLFNEYNENGKLIKQTNWDTNYNFSIYDLAAKIKKELDIDILHTCRGLDVRRSMKNQVHYEIAIGEACKCSCRVIMVDGKTGKTISDNIVPYPSEATI